MTNLYDRVNPRASRLIFSQSALEIHYKSHLKRRQITKDLGLEAEIMPTNYAVKALFFHLINSGK